MIVTVTDLVPLHSAIDGNASAQISTEYFHYKSVSIFDLDLHSFTTTNNIDDTMDHHLPQGRPARTIPDFLLQDHPPHSAIPPMAMGYNNNLALEQALQREIQMRNEQIRQLQMDNMRLQFKLEQAEKDVKAATDMILVACRSGGGAQQSLNPIQRPTAQHIEETNNEAYDIGGHRFDLGDERQGRLQIPVFRRGPARRYGNGFCGAGGDVAGAMQAGADVRHGWSETEEK